MREKKGERNKGVKRGEVEKKWRGGGRGNKRRKERAEGRMRKTRGIKCISILTELIK